ncbi:MAG TPA: cobalamin-dependent protein [Pirellulales bacterium]|nr:cobalamin-dependent protein [Pirellulales bacterium]
MPHVAFVPFTGLRVREQELLELGMSLPGLRERADAIAELPALGLLTLAGLTPPDWSCSYQPAGDVGRESLIDYIVDQRPTLVAVSMLTASAEEAYQFCAGLRRAGLRTVIGGLHATACPEEARNWCDAVVVGHGEPVWQALLADAAAGELRPLYRAPRIYNLVQAPLPRFDLLGSPLPARFTVQTQRGCPLACEFCGASRLLGRFSEKPASLIERELDSIKAILPRPSPSRLSVSKPLIELADDNTFAGDRDLDELCDVLTRANVRYFTEADWRIGKTPDLVRRLANSGCLQVLVGLESQIFRYPGMGEKLTAWNTIIDALTAIQEAGVAVNGCFILGADGETRRSLDRLIEFILDSPLADVQLTLQTAFPGTALRHRLYKEGRLLADRGWPYYTLFDVTYRPDRLNVAELETAFRDCLRVVFAPDAVARRRNIRGQIWRVKGKAPTEVIQD